MTLNVMGDAQRLHEQEEAGFAFHEMDSHADYSQILNDLNYPKKLSIVYNKNADQNLNHLNAIRAVKNYSDFDLFIKIDDDDIYKTDYVKNIVDFMSNNNCDICSSKVKWELNGFNLHSVNVSDLGGNPEQTNYHMPPSFAFNRRALQCILDLEKVEAPPGVWEDKLWRQSWTSAGLKHLEIDNTEQWIWHIHGNNVSIGHFLRIGGVDFPGHYSKFKQVYEQFGKNRDYLKDIWVWEGKVIVFEISLPNYNLAFDVFSRNLVNFEIEVQDRSRKLKLNDIYDSFDFRDGYKLKLLEINLKSDADYQMIVITIDGFIDAVIKMTA
jgi:hypothetical protein